MIEPKPHPKRLPRWLGRLARWSLGLVLALWLMVAAVWGVLHGWIVPRIGEWRPQLQALATRSLGIPVTIGAISAQSSGVIPSFELRDVVLHDPGNGSKALHLSKVMIAVSAHSLMTLGVEQIYIEAPELAVRRSADGKLYVAGLPIDRPGGGDSRVTDWLFSQPEVALRHGSVQWVDELRQAPPLQLTQVDLVIRNKGWQHQVRFDASPPPDWGQRFTIMGRFSEPLLSIHEGRIERWSGKAFADFGHIDLSALSPYLDPQSWQLQQGRGAIRAWLELRQGQPVGLLADVSIDALQVQWRDRDKPLHLQSLQGRFDIQHRQDYRLAVQGLSFTTGDGMQWPKGDIKASYSPTGTREQGRLGEHGQVQVDGVDIGIATQLLLRLPLPESAHGQLAALAPQGLLRQARWSWRGPVDAPVTYKAQGRVENLRLQAQPSHEGPDVLGIPGVQGLSASFELDQDSGQAQLEKSAASQALVLSLPGMFELPDVGFDQFRSQLRWQIKGQAIQAQMPDLQFANADAQGKAQVAWHTGEGSDKRPRFPGVLELKGQLARGSAASVHRYLPLGIPADARQYVRQAVKSGQASQVNFKLRGYLEEFPFEKPGQGEFQITAQLHDVDYDYVPAYLLDPGQQPWPPLHRLSGEFSMDRNALAVRNVKGQLAGAGAIRVDEARAAIADLSQPEVLVGAKAHGGLNDMLAVVRGSALSALLDHALDESQGAGNAQLALQLRLPIHDMERSKVQGSLALGDGRFSLMPEVPEVQQVRGTLQFTESGFSLAGVKARALGGELAFDGGLKLAAQRTPLTVSPLNINVRGTATAQGLREARPLAAVRFLTEHLQGQAEYGLQIRLRRGQPEVMLQTSLQGMAVALPEPLGKPAATAVPVRWSQQLTPESVAAEAAPIRDLVSLQWGRALDASYERDLHAAATVLRGSVRIAGDGAALPGPAGLPEKGVNAQARLAHLDLDRWLGLLPDESAAPGADPQAGTDWRQYLPGHFALDAGSLQVKGRTLHDVSLGLTRAGAAWHSNVTARELAGYIEYREGTPQEPAGQVIARLSRLNIPKAAQSSVDSLLSDGERVRELPALQIAVENTRLGELALGRLEVQARNRLLAQPVPRRQWQLSRFNISNADASLSASGEWVIPMGQGSQPGRTQLKFDLALNDVGRLLVRLGMADVVAGGKGMLQGEVGWTGAPIAPDYRSMSGDVHMDVQTGRFLKAEPGLAKLVGVLSLQALPRRLLLDFRDVFRNGFSFDFMRGDVQIREGVAHTNNMQMKGVNAAVLMEGSADLDKETQSLHVVIVPELNAMTASLVATAINPVVGLGSFLAQFFLRGPLNAAMTKEFKIDGSWTDPQVTEVSRGAKNGAAAQQPAGPESATTQSQELP